MGQVEVHEVISSDKSKWWTLKDIKILLPELTTIGRSLARLRFYGEIEWKIDNQGRYSYKFKK